MSNCLEVLYDVIVKFGSLLPAEQAQLRDHLLPLLEDGRTGIKKRTIHCFGRLFNEHQRKNARFAKSSQHSYVREGVCSTAVDPSACVPETELAGAAGALTPYLSDSALASIVDPILSKLQSNRIKAEDRQTYIQAVAALRCGCLAC